MAQNQNTQTTNNLVNETRLSLSYDEIPKQINQSIQPVIDISSLPHLTTTKTYVGNAINATTNSIFVTSLTKKTYINAIVLTMAKDATSTSVASGIYCNVNGAVVYLCSINGFTLTAQSQTLTLSLDKPLLVDPNSSVVVYNGSAVANVSTSAYVYVTEID